MKVLSPLRQKQQSDSNIDDIVTEYIAYHLKQNKEKEVHKEYEAMFYFVEVLWISFKSLKREREARIKL